MSEQFARLSDVADIRPSNVDKRVNRGERPVQLCNYLDVYNNDYITADLPFMQATASDAEARRFGIEPGDVLITKDSETPDDIGVPSVVIEAVADLVAGYHLALLKPDTSLVDPVYLAKHLSSDVTARYFAQRANGSTRYGLTSRSLAETPLYLPPLDQQHVAARIFVTIDAAIQRTQSLIAKTQQIRAGLMQDLFRRGVMLNGEMRASQEDAPHLYKQSPVGLVPCEWTVDHLASARRGDRPHLKTGPFGSSLKLEHWVEIGHPVITIGSLAQGEFIHSELLFVGPDTVRRMREFQLAPGDLVFSRVADVGRSAVIRPEQGGWIMSGNMMRISLDPSRVIPDYLQYQLAGDTRVRRQIRRTVNSGGRDVANSATMNRLWFAWPPRDEQGRIVSTIAALDARLRAEGNLARTLRSVRAGLMRDLLSGCASAPANQDRMAVASV